MTPASRSTKNCCCCRVGSRRHSFRSPALHIPPDLRPRFAPHKHHILFEAREWQDYLVAPFLMRRPHDYHQKAVIVTEIQTTTAVCK
jgi:hypothetical protein